ncbi:MAG: PASTA domain-containing protein [Bacteroidia bacterium]|nr:PASTA domain-containing protein [Bacteroidia bacterium]MCZ2249880.1 PASTA domain-containing protein [Bacteroidia bacterium]
MNASKKKIVKHVAIIAVIYVISIWGILLWLKDFTQHGIKVKVPDVSGLKPQQVKELSNKYDLKFMIVDSVYSSDKERGTVIDQNPSPGSEVKQNRKVYLTINSFHPPTIKMPKLIDLSYRQAKSILETYGLVPGNIIYEPDYAKDAVLKQLYKGRELKPGDPVVLESKIDLVLGDGLKGEKIDLPYLIGSKRNEALNILKQNSLTIGAEVFDKSVNDTTAAIVYRQFPTYYNNAQVSKGRSVDLFFTQDASKIKQAQDSVKLREINDENNE